MTRPAIWSDIADTLRSEIGAGHYRPRDRIPTEAALANRFGVNRHTIRRALAQLADEGILHARRGAGVFVAVPPTGYPIGRRVRFHQNLEAAGRVPGRRITALQTRAADLAEAAALALGPGAPVHVAEGLSLADEEPIAIFRSIFPANRFPGLLAELDKEGSVTRALAAMGIADYLRADTRISATIATPTQALRLRLQPGAPLLLSVAVNTDLGGVPLEYGTTWFAAERVTLTVPAHAISG